MQNCHSYLGFFYISKFSKRKYKRKNKLYNLHEISVKKKRNFVKFKKEKPFVLMYFFKSTLSCSKLERYSKKDFASSCSNSSSQIIDYFWIKFTVFIAIFWHLISPDQKRIRIMVQTIDPLFKPLCTHSSFINSWGMKNSCISKYWCAPISLKLPCNC